jgi:tRNA threonylcarbamoyl adenosine modification protein YeaZ
MFLYINTSNPSNLCLALLDSKGVVLVQKTLSAQYQQSEKLLKAIKKLVSRQIVSNKKQVEHNFLGLIVAKGPGNFTALRIGVATANALAFGLNIPIVGIKVKIGETDQQLIARGFKLLSKARLGKYVVPEYGQAPKITLKPA